VGTGGYCWLFRLSYVTCLSHWFCLLALFYYSITIFLKSYFCCLIIHTAQTKQSKSTYATGVYIPFKRKAKGAGRDQPIFWVPCHVGHRGSDERKYLAKCELFRSWSTYSWLLMTQPWRREQCVRVCNVLIYGVVHWSYTYCTCHARGFSCAI
jgi:hypothetical protein